ncbi:pyridoxal-phosphate dependent enzyme [Nocardia crassostreae]|uniref:pyridoxal-phosphate dependent enzyme n=1 Tax=Nocardia crassostreae TaxID=53428 RepID=UPI000ACCF4F6|nr:pyridoxal-phosphate dependent enzyme [Nocardia crassostreae]
MTSATGSATVYGHRVSSPTHGDVKAAADRIAGVVRPLSVIAADQDLLPGANAYLALEFLQYTGSFKARGAVNLIAALRDSAALPDAGLAASTGLNADLGFAWAAQRFGVPITVFLAADAPAAKVARLGAFGAKVRLGGATQAEAQSAAHEFITKTGAIDPYTHNNALTSAGAGTILLDLTHAVPDLDTVVVAVGAGGMFAGITAAAAHLGIRVVGAEPAGSQALHAALAADSVLDVEIDSIAADSLGAPRIWPPALEWARTADVHSVIVDDADIIATRRLLWSHHRIAVEHGSATGLAALRTAAYTPTPTERIAFILCGANTDPTDLSPHG